MADVLVLLGSANDAEYAEGCLKILGDFQIPFHLKVASAHRSPNLLFKTIETEGSKAKVILAFAGHAAHLAGVIAAHTTKPVIAVPLPTSDLKGLDALLASVQMPAGVPVAVMALGQAGSRNAACFAAQILALQNPALAEKLTLYKRELAEKVADGARDLEAKWQ